MRKLVWVSALLLVVVATSSETALSSSDDAPFSARSTDVLVQLGETAAGSLCRYPILPFRPTDRLAYDTD